MPIHPQLNKVAVHIELGVAKCAFNVQSAECISMCNVQTVITVHCVGSCQPPSEQLVLLPGRQAGGMGNEPKLAL